MKKIEVYKAQGIADVLVESVMISIVKEIPEDKERTIAGVNQRFNSDAELIVNALLDSLPQGTTDRVLAKLMMRKATSFVMPMENS